MTLSLFLGVNEVNAGTCPAVTYAGRTYSLNLSTSGTLSGTAIFPNWADTGYKVEIVWSGPAGKCPSQAEFNVTMNWLRDVDAQEFWNRGVNTWTRPLSCGNTHSYSKVLDGVCGTASTGGQSYAVAPTENLCAKGSANTAQEYSTDPGKWWWQCTGVGTGAVSPWCSAPIATAPNATCSVTSNPSDPSELTFSINATGGKVPYTYDWTGAVTGTTSSITKKFTTSGTKEATVVVTDANNKTVSKVCSGNPGNVDVSCNVSQNSVDLGENVDFWAGINGEYSSLRWSGAVSGTSPRVTTSFNTTGTKTATVTVTPTNTARPPVTETCSVSVHNSSNPDSYECVVETEDAVAGESVGLELRGPGLDNGYNVSWNINGIASGLFGRNVNFTVPGFGVFIPSVTATKVGKTTIAKDCSPIVNLPKPVGTVTPKIVEEDRQCTVAWEISQAATCSVINEAGGIEGSTVNSTSGSVRVDAGKNVKISCAFNDYLGNPHTTETEVLACVKKPKLIEF